MLESDIMFPLSVLNLAAKYGVRNYMTVGTGLPDQLLHTVLQGYRLLPVGSGENHSIREIMSFMKCNLQSSGKLMYGNTPGRTEEPDTLADIGWYKEIAYRLKFTYWEGLKAYTTE